MGTHLLGFRPVCAVEKEPYCREVLLQRQRDRVLPLFPIWDRIETFDGKEWRGKIDVVTGGFPCQPFSVAGKRKGADDERNLWPETIRIVKEVAPAYCFFENVPGLIRSGYFGQILEDLMDAGYDAEWCVLGADDVGAPHRRKRLWILAHSKVNALGSGLCKGEQGRQRGRRSSDGGSEVANADQFNDDSRRHGASKVQRKRSEQTDLRESEQGNMADTESKREKLRSAEEKRSRRFTGCGDKMENSERPRRKIQGHGKHREEEAKTKKTTQFARPDNIEKHGQRITWWNEDPADLPNSNSDGRNQEGQGVASTGGHGIVGENGRPTKSGMGKLVDGISVKVGEPGADGGRYIPRVEKGILNRVEKLKALGNAQVPAVVCRAWETLIQYLDTE